MSSLSYSTGINTIADVKCENVSVEQAVGRYRLLFELSFDLKNWEDNMFHQGYISSLTSLRVVVKLNDAVVGTAFPKEEDFLPPVRPGTSNTVTVRRRFALDLDRLALEEIEQVRRGQDITFELEVIGTATVFALRDANFQHASSFPEPLGIEPLLFEPCLAKADIRHQVPQSKWIELLDRMGYARILLYEIPWPKSEDDKLNEAISHFESARASFLSGFYTDSVVHLRKSLDSACAAIGCENNANWSNVAKRESREGMMLQERFLLAWNSVRHLTHPAAHHNGSYSREEALYILGMGALALSLAANAPGVLRGTSEGGDDAD